MKPYCKNCINYSPEYQGYATEFINYCKLKKEQIELNGFCIKWSEASDEEMAMRKKVWKLWDVLERSVQI